MTHHRTGTFRVTGDPVGDGRQVPYEFEFEVFDAWSLEAQALVLPHLGDRPVVTGHLRTDSGTFGSSVSDAIADAIMLASHEVYDGMSFVVHARLRRATATHSLQHRATPLKNAEATLIQYVPTHWQEKGSDQQFSIRTWDREELLAWSYAGPEERSPYELRLDELWAMHDAGRAMAA